MISTRNSLTRKQKSTVADQPLFLLLAREPKRTRLIPFPFTNRKSRGLKSCCSTKVEQHESVQVKNPIREIPGTYGAPFFGPIKDRLDYFYNQGTDEFFRSRVEKYKSTVFRVNMPPGPFIVENSNVIVLLDGNSFPVLFDVDKVEKKNLLTGTYLPSLKLTGGHRVLSYLDPAEPSHAKLKTLIFFLLKSCSSRIIPEFSSTYTEMFDKLELEVSSKGKADFGSNADQATFNFLARAMFGTNPADTKLGDSGPAIMAKWFLLQFHPILSLGLPKFIEDPLLHTFRLPAWLVKSGYQKLYDFFYESAGTVLDEAEKMGISREEACHNILFAVCFNSYGGLNILFPNIVKYIGLAGPELHTQLASEIRSAIKSAGGNITMSAMENMPLTKSVVYESLRIEPPVTLQYGKAKRDLVVESHDAAFNVKEGEILCGYQPFATRDPKIFHMGEEFVADRFVGKEDGEKLLKHLLWSNGPQTGTTLVANKQCAGKDFVVMVARLFVIQIFQRYDSFEIEVSTSAFGTTTKITSLKGAII